MCSKLAYIMICYFEMINIWETPLFRYLSEALECLVKEEREMNINIC